MSTGSNGPTQWTMQSAHQRLTEYLGQRKVETPRLAAEILVAHALSIPRIQIYTAFERSLTREEVDGIGALGKRLAKGEPLQLVVGNAAFLAHTFAVRRGVFIPRPETEVLADYCIRRLAGKAARFADVCCGTGVIGVSLLKALPEARGVATDVSEEAVGLTRENAEGLGVGDRLEVVRGDLLEGAVVPEEGFDAVVSNPPYIPTGDIEGLDAVVRDYDPREALDGGEDGLDVVRRIVPAAMGVLKPEGFVALEIGIGQAAATAEILRGAGFADVQVEKDLSGIERVVAGTRAGKSYVF